MDFGMFMEFGRRQGASDTQAFQEGFDLVDAAESWGLDGAWLAELHLNPGRSVLSSPVMTACSIATRTKRMRVGMAVYVLPLNHPLRIAEEAATIDQISEGRFDMGIGRSGFARAYDCYGIPYSDSREMFRESVDIILEAWKGEPFSYQGQFYHIDNATLTPRPYQQPHPPLRVAATTAESFPRIGAQGYPIFVGLRGMDIPELRANLKEYRKAWTAAGHPGHGDVALRIPVYAGETQAEALEEPRESINTYFGRMGNLYRESAGRAGIDATELRQGRADRLAGLGYDQILENKVAFGTGKSLVERFATLKDELGLDNVVAELNAGGLIPADRVKRSLKILTHQVMPEFK
jgi:alkanesulfonate monooxygenase SsuD/methylene tetrahydromethanopterin reductase-like flavin-dependent oxidoreductase (luciferase family)